MSAAPPVAAVIADIVGSRALPDRDRAQEQILAAFAAAEQDVPPLPQADPEAQVEARGQRRALDAGGDGIEDGTAWYRAREAVERAHERAAGAATAFRAADPSLTAAVDGLVLLRDHVLGRLKARERRIAAALLGGATQAEAARAERITQSAVSQAVARSGIDRLLELDDELAAAATEVAP